MARVKGSNIHKNRRKKILKLAKGYFGSKHKLYKTAKEQVMHSLKYAYRDRKQNKREIHLRTYVHNIQTRNPKKQNDNKLKQNKQTQKPIRVNAKPDLTLFETTRNN